MNVTSKGYFTTQFLDKQKQNSPRSHYRSRYDHDSLDYSDYDNNDHSGWDAASNYPPYGYNQHAAHRSHGDLSRITELDEAFEPSSHHPSLKSKRSRGTLASNQHSPTNSPRSAISATTKNSPVSKHSYADTVVPESVRTIPKSEIVRSKQPEAVRSNLKAESMKLDSESLKDPDYLKQEITPAQLTFLQNNSARPYRRHNPSPKQPEETSKKSYADYYIKQKEQYDGADYKPKLYTHKTFRDVFVNKEESTDKYNPMEFVFDEPPEETNLKRAFKNLQVKMGKDNYSAYDYYEHKNSPPKTEVFVNEVSDDDELEGGEVKKKKKISKMLKQRAKLAKKELGRNFMSNAERQRVIHDLVKEREMKKKKKKGINVDEPIPVEKTTDLVESEPEPPIGEEKEVKELESVKDNKEVLQEEEKADASSVRSFGPNPNFHPAWNYLLSWIVYDNKGKKADVEEPEIRSAKSKKSAKSAAAAAAAKASKLKNIKKGYTTVVSRWNEPMGTLFKDPSTGTIVKSRSSPYSSLPRSDLDEVYDDESQEFVIEIEDDGSDANMELYYNPITKQLEATPPTSMGSLQVDPNAKKGWNLDAKNLPVSIISNVNSLIKNIKIMKIIFGPIDVIGEMFPTLQTVVIVAELVIFVWMLYELSLLIDALCMMVKAVCAPMIAMGRFMNRVM